jgi:hypothetical protein
MDDLEGVAVIRGRFVGDRPSAEREEKGREGTGEAEGVMSEFFAGRVCCFRLSIAVHHVEQRAQYRVCLRTCFETPRPWFQPLRGLQVWP